MTKDSIRFLEDGAVEALLPKAFYLAMIRIQAEKGLDWNEACIFAAELIDSSSARFKREVEKEARRLYNGELMRQMNTARETIKGNAYESGYSSGYEEGKNEGTAWYFCSVCGKRIDITPNGKAHASLIEYMRSAGWGHSNCLQKDR